MLKLRTNDVWLVIKLMGWEIRNFMANTINSIEFWDVYTPSTAIAGVYGSIMLNAKRKS